MRSRCLLPVLAIFSLSSALSRGESPDFKPIQIESADLSIAPATRKTIDLKSLPDRLQQLIGKQVTIRGYPYWTKFTENVTAFALCLEIKGRGVSWSAEPPMEFIVDIRTKPGEGISISEEDFFRKPFKVIGTLELIRDSSDGEDFSYFRISGATVERTAPRDGYHSSVHFGC